MASPRLVVPFEELRMTDVEEVGGKNASLGEMIGELAAAGIRVPGGFATTAYAFREFLGHSDLAARIARRLEGLDVEDVRALAEAGREIRGWIAQAPLHPSLEAAIRSAYERLAGASPNALISMPPSAQPGAPGANDDMRPAS